MTENFLNLVKETDTQVQEAQRVPNKMNPKKLTQRHIIIKMPKVEHKEKNLKSSKRKAVSYLQGSFHKTVSCFLNGNFAGQKEVARNIQSDEKQGPTTKITILIEVIIQNQRTYKELPRQEKVKGVHYQQTSIT